MIESQGEPWKVTDAKIRHLCSYILTDSAVAGYFGVPIERVARIRKSMQAAANREFRKSRHCGDGRRSGDEPAGTTVYVDREKVTASTGALLARLVAVLERQAQSRGETYADAVIRNVHGNDPARVRLLAIQRATCPLEQPAAGQYPLSNRSSGGAAPEPQDPSGAPGGDGCDSTRASLPGASGEA